MDNSLANFELSASTVRIGSDSEKSSEKSDTFEELLDTDTSNESSNDVTTSREDFDNNLPETVTLLRNPLTGFKVYLVGTAHFSKESQDDVMKVIRTVQPHVIVLELCSARTTILSLDEAAVLEEAKSINIHKIRSTIKANGVYNGVMHLLLLNMTAHITKEIGMAPGGEFRVAYHEAMQLAKCGIHLGDRPIQITLKRALARLSWYQTIKLAWHLLTTKDPISKEEIERCKRRDMLEQLLAEMAGEYPALGEVFVDERDIYLTHSLQMASSARLQPLTYMQNLKEPLRVVGVVGMGHVVGITRRWSVDQSPYIADVLTIPPQSKSSKIFHITFKISLLTLGGYLIYRHVPIPKVLKAGYETALDKFMSSIRSR